MKTETHAATAAGTGPDGPDLVRPYVAAGTAPAATTAPARPSVSVPSTAAAGDDGTLRAGDSGPAVAELQRLLFAQGFTYVTVNGRYDAATVRGVTQLQQDRGLSGDPAGVYGPATRAALTSG